MAKQAAGGCFPPEASLQSASGEWATGIKARVGAPAIAEDNLSRCCSSGNVRTLDTGAHSGGNCITSGEEAPAAEKGAPAVGEPDTGGGCTPSEEDRTPATAEYNGGKCIPSVEGGCPLPGCGWPAAGLGECR
jgi:hypothetical protein